MTDRPGLPWLSEAWSPQSRVAAAAARKGHGSPGAARMAAQELGDADLRNLSRVGEPGMASTVVLGDQPPATQQSLRKLEAHGHVTIDTRGRAFITEAGKKRRGA